MKGLTQYINEANHKFNLTERERRALVEFIGILLGHFDDDRGILDKVEVDDDKRERLMDAFDILNDEHTWPKINYRLIKDEFKSIREHVLYAYDYDLFEDDPDMLDVVEKLRAVQL